MLSNMQRDAFGERIHNLWKQYGLLSLGAVIFIIVCALGVSWYLNQQENYRQQQAVSYISLLNNKDNFSELQKMVSKDTLQRNDVYGTLTVSLLINSAMDELIKLSGGIDKLFEKNNNDGLSASAKGKISSLKEKIKNYAAMLATKKIYNYDYETLRAVCLSRVDMVFNTNLITIDKLRQLSIADGAFTTLVKENLALRMMQQKDFDKNAVRKLLLEIINDKKNTLYSVRSRCNAFLKSIQ